MDEFLQLAEHLKFAEFKKWPSQGHFCFIQPKKIMLPPVEKGLKTNLKKTTSGYQFSLIVSKNTQLIKPIFLCLGIFKTKGQLKFFPEIILEKNSQAKILAYCLFPQAQKITHQMKAKIKLEKGAKLIFQEKHFHGQKKGAQVQADLEMTLAKESCCQAEFILSQGRVGLLQIKLNASLAEKSLFEGETKIIGQAKNDQIRILEKTSLLGAYARSLLKMRAVAKNGAQIILQGETYASAKGARGHIDCQEIISGEKSLARALPFVEVTHPQARVTHEASIGRIDQKQLETLLTKGLSEKKAIDFIIKGFLK